MTANELMQGGPRPCEHCESDLAQVGKGCRFCPECERDFYADRGSKGRDANEYEQMMSDIMEATGDSLEQGARSPAFGSRAWPGAKATDYDRSDE